METVLGLAPTLLIIEQQSGAAENIVSKPVVSQMETEQGA